MSVKGASQPLFVSDSPKLQEKREEADTSIHAAVKAVFQKIVDLLLLVWFALQYTSNAMSECKLSTWQEIFGDKVICMTANHAKFAELPKYVALRHSPHVDTSALENACTLGFTPKKTALVPEPFSEGHCFGNTTVFLKTWQETGSIDRVIEVFEEGSPIQGAIYQEAYEQFCESVHYPEFCSMILRVINCYPIISFAEEMQKWKRSDFHPALVVLEALQAYLSAGNHPKEGGFTAYITNWVKEHRGTHLEGKFLASIRNVEERFFKEDLTEMYRMQAAFSFAGLRIEQFHHIGSQPGDILKTLSVLDSGSFKLSFPVYSSTGSLEGAHATGIIINHDVCYFLEPNGAIAYCEKKELSQTIGRLFTFYTGLDFKENPDGNRPTFWKKVSNFFHETANPPSTPLASHFDLIEVH